MFRYYPTWKRFLDILVSITGIFLFSPVLVIIAVWIKLDSPGPLLFWQKRVGINKSTFNMMKFRTMRIDAPKDVATHLLENPEAYITVSGRFLRRTSLDELPQLFHILLGQMSVVGPRPALWNQFDLIELRDLYGANHLPPGLTGWAQIHGRDENDIETKAKLDGYYARHISFMMDAKCFLRTFLKVLKSEGYVEGQAASKTEQSHK